MTNTIKSPRRNLTDSLRRHAEAVRGGRYFVKRGQINWMEFDFTIAERAFAIMVDETTLFRDADNDATITLELATRIPNPDEHPDLDDGVLDEFLDDAVYVIRSMSQDVDPEGDFVGDAMLRTVRALEFYDPEFRLQGITVSFQVKY